MSETVQSTATVVEDAPVSKPRFSKRTKMIAAGVTATTVAVAAAVFVKSREEDESSDEIVTYDPSVVETLTDLTDPNQS